MAMPYPGIDGDQPATWQPDHVSDGACVDGNDGDGIHSMLESSNVQDGSLRRLFDSEVGHVCLAAQSRVADVHAAHGATLPSALRG